MLQRELRLAGVTRYELVGKIDGEAGARDEPGAPITRLGGLEEIGTLVREFEIDLLLMTAECARMPVFEAIGSCLHLRVRLTELSTFYEETFGHVPAGEINAAWFQYLVHPSYHQPSAAAKRALDVLGALVLGIPFLVALVVLAPLIRRDGGPVFFWQERVGEGGRTLRMCKLRTMCVGSAATWACPDDPRVTRIGRMLRRTHIDELPQLLHVLCGEMSLVGPRPEQRHLVEQLEREIAFYSSRHLVRPGIAGWAQLRCGYAGSDVGSAWKLCHDLYYLKHRSLAFDLAILGETARTLFADTQRVPDPTGAWFIVGHDGAASAVQPIAIAHELPVG
jgi:lipopolysaccharide/colanic/teichoic acid biosynthesis glycosyltransferase